MVIVLALAFFMSATVTIYTLFRSGDTRVPNVIGRSETEAQQIALKAGLNVKIQRRSDDRIPPNTVIETRPGPNSSVKKESALTIVVSTGPVQTKSETEHRSAFLVARLSFPGTGNLGCANKPQTRNEKRETRNDKRRL